MFQSSSRISSALRFRLHIGFAARRINRKRDVLMRDFPFAADFSQAIGHAEGHIKLLAVFVGAAD
jgi:hypothetical protein